MKKIVLLIIILILALLVINGFLIREWYPKVEDRSELIAKTYPDLLKFSIQLILLVIGGGIIVQEYNRSRQKIITYKELRKEMYKALVNVYLKTKSIRWAFRVDCKNDRMDYKVYKEGLAKVIEIKTQLEVLIHQINAHDSPFKSIKAELLANLEKMEDYIRVLYKEYDEKAPVFIEQDKIINTSELQKFNSFITRSIDKNNTNGMRKHDPGRPDDEKSPFTLHYRVPFFECLDLLRENEVSQRDID